MKAAVIGQPISHSLSPAIFRFLRDRESARLDYEARELAPDQLNSFLLQLKQDPEWRGVNVTLPHKEAVIVQLDSLSEDAKAVGAVNVIQVRKGLLMGHNTDCEGIEKTLHYAGFSVRGKNCFVFGAGGSAKAVIHVLGKSGAGSVAIYNPRSDRALELVKRAQSLHPSTQFSELSKLPERFEKPFSLVVNTTPVGMNIQDPDFFAPLAIIPFENNALAFDLIYTPEHTEFLKQARAQNLREVGGLGMLVDQALATWEIWMGGLRNLDQSREDLLKYLKGILLLRSNPMPVFLTGFMGVGKSTIAHELSKQVNRSFHDTDRLIEHQSGHSVSEIFALQGEAKFRSLEKKALMELALTRSAVIALGGGILNDPENLELIQKSGRLVHLSASLQTLNQRLDKGARTRPLLEGLSDQERSEKIEALLNERMSTYQKADIQVTIDDRRPQEVVEQILIALGSLV